MARSTYMTFLMHKPANGSAYEKVVDIKSFPDMGSVPEKIDTTTLSDRMETGVPGVISLDTMEFECNYDKEDYQKVKALEGKEQDFSIWMGGTEGSDGKPVPNGEEGKFDFKGELTVYITGGGVNEVTGMNIAIVASTPIVENFD